MNRRDTVLLPLALGAAGLPVRGFAQTRNGGKPFRIALLPNIGGGLDHLRIVLLDSLREAGRLEGRDFTLLRPDIPPSPDIEPLVKRVIDEAPDLIFAVNTRYAAAAQRLTRTIPIVMWASGFPVEAGVADSMARPGRNATGVSTYAGTGVFGKHIQLLRDAKPGIKRVGVFWVHVPPSFSRAEIEPCHADIREAAQRLGLEVRILEIASPDRVDAALAVMNEERIEAMALTFGAPLAGQQQKIMDFALQKRLPTLSEYLWLRVDPQPLMVYGASVPVMVRQAAGHVDRILWGGAKPGDLPIQQPTRIELVVNMKTAKAIGLTIPQSLLLRADEVIQ